MSAQEQLVSDLAKESARKKAAKKAKRKEEEEKERQRKLEDDLATANEELVKIYILFLWFEIYIQLQILVVFTQECTISSVQARFRKQEQKKVRKNLKSRSPHEDAGAFEKELEKFQRVAALVNQGRDNSGEKKKKKKREKEKEESD